MFRKISSLFVAQGKIGNTIVSDGNNPHFCIDTDINSLEVFERQTATVREKNVDS